MKLYPVGNTKATTFLDTPNFSKFSIAIGRADSLLAVANANETGSETAFKNCLIGTFAIKAIGRKTHKTNAINAM